MLKTKEERQIDLNPQETSEWLEALEQVVDEAGPDRAAYLLEKLIDRAAEFGVSAARPINTPYVNTIPAHEEVPYPGDRALERRIKSLIRWNAAAMVVRANKYDPNIGGHISTYASLATISEVGFQSFLPRQQRWPARRPGLLPGSRFAGRVRARVSRGRLTEATLAEFPS